MSVIATVFLPDGIIMATDSRITGSNTSNENGLTKETIFTLSDNGQKLFLINNKTGISFCGKEEIGGKTMADFIDSFEKNKISDKDDVYEIAQKLRQEVFIYDKSGVDYFFHVAGYTKGKQEVYSVSSQLAKLINSEPAGAWNGDAAFLTNLINGNPPMSFDWSHMYLKDGIELAEFMVDVNCKAQRFSSTIATCGGPIDILLITKDEARWIRHKILNP